MQTTNLIKGIVVAAALVAGTTVAMANSTLTIASGTKDTIVAGFGTGTHGTVTGVQAFPGVYEAIADFSDGWNVSVTEGNAGGGPSIIDLSTVDQGKTASPITITFTSSYYPVGGDWSEMNGGNVSSDLGVKIAVYDGSLGTTPLSVANYAGSSVNTKMNPYHIVSLDSDPTTGGPFFGHTALLGKFTEVITITPLLNVNQLVSLDNTFTMVPDGGTTMVLLGSALTGIAGLRSKFGFKRA